MKTIEPTVAVQHPFLSGLPEQFVHLVAEAGKRKTFRSDDYLFRAGKLAANFYLIHKGRVSVEIYDTRRGIIPVQTLNPPNVLGWSWLVPPFSWCFDARALETCHATVIDAVKLRELCEQDHLAGYELLKRFSGVFAERLHAARYKLLDLIGQSI